MTYPKEKVNVICPDGCKVEGMIYYACKKHEGKNPLIDWIDSFKRKVL